MSDLKDMVVTATRGATRISDVVADVTVINREALAASVGQTLPQVLSHQAGVQFSSNGGMGKTSSVFMRGGQTRHTLVLIDGVRFGSATTGAPSLENFPVDAIERIEVVRGPLASLYGSEAAAGVVQIITRKGQQGLHPSASVTLGADHFWETTANLAGGQDAWQYNLGLSALRTSGFSATNPKVGSGYNPDRDGFLQQSVQLSVSRKLTPDWSVQASGLLAVGKSEYDDGVLASRPSLNTRQEFRTSMAALKVSGKVLAGWNTQLQLSRGYDGSNTVEAKSAFSLGRFATAQTQLSWENQVALPLGQLLVAQDHIRQDVDSTTAYPVTARTVDALVLGWSGEVGPHVWQTSVREDHNSQFGSQPTGTVAYGYEVVTGWRLGGSVGSTFVAPSFNQLYFPGFGKANLQPEKGVNREISLKHTQEHGHWRLAWFDDNIKGFLQTGTTVSVIPRVQMQGWSLSTEQRCATQVGDLQFSGSIDWLDAHDVATGKKLQRRSNTVAMGDVGLVRGSWRYGMNLTAKDGMFDDAANTPAKRLGGQGLWGASVRWQVDPQWAASLRVDNLVNRTYYTAYGYNQPGRQAFLTLAWTPR